MRNTMTALAAAATIAAATVAMPSAADAGGRNWLGPAIIGGIAAGIFVGTQIAQPR
jgi:hypothetical protein